MGRRDDDDNGDDDNDDDDDDSGDDDAELRCRETCSYARWAEQPGARRGSQPTASELPGSRQDHWAY